MRRMFMSVLAVLTVTMAVGAQAAERESATIAPHVTIRVFDPYRHDYHRWNAAERRSYREYLAARHRRYVAYERQRAAERRAYWHWRHERLEHRR